ncbi:hypothetical protein [Rheinheimera maricola]|uniref:Uncharacterized protein n=1 Tax=Rheinheimera maricola TaxID=2793282 RepID=A0ABS7XD07_9GAMM|nr:hypothetical protein [Rheinheimera maricola]MBZ9613432.1 hypothetical protein [Rheinheimera maricola]
MKKPKIAWLLLCLLFWLFCSAAYCQNSARLIEAIAAIEAEIQVRHYHLAETSYNDKELTHEKLKQLELDKAKLYSTLRADINAKSSSDLLSKADNLTETFAFNDDLKHKCQLNEDLENCLTRGILTVVKKAILAFVDNADQIPELPTQIPESGSLTLTKFQKLKYTANYDVSFSEDGAVMYLLRVSGALTKIPSDEDLQKLTQNLEQQLQAEVQSKIQQLAMQYKVSLMYDESLIEKPKKKKRLIGSF